EIDQEFNALLQRLRAGDEEAARFLLARYGPHILRVVRRRLDRKLRSKFDSLDFMQDVWASFFAQRPPENAFASPQALFAFLATLARNTVVEAVRQRFVGKKYNINRECSLEDSEGGRGQRAAHQATPSEIVVAQEEWDRLLDRRSPEQQQILVMLRLGYTHAEIAGKLGVCEKTVARLVQKIALEATP